MPPQSGQRPASKAGGAIHSAIPAHVPHEILVESTNGTNFDEVRKATRGSVRTMPSTGFPVGLVDLPKTTSIVSAAARVAKLPNIRYAEPNSISEPDQVIPNDPLFPDEWGLQNTGQDHPIWDPPPTSVSGLSGADGSVSEAWSVTEGSPETVIAVLDSGVDLSHPDLTANLWTNSGEIAGNGIDDDGNGFVDDINGYDFYSNDPVPDDENGHGTHLAGIIAAAVNNGVGGAGVCPSCRIMAVRAGAPDGSLPEAAILNGLVYAVTNGADIVNMSFGEHVWSGIERDAIAWAGKNGVLVVAAAGNEAFDNDSLVWLRSGPNPPSYPASYDLPNIISVAASNDLDQYGYLTGCSLQGGGRGCFFTNWGGTSTDLAAPGVDIESTYPPSSYMVEDGTSMAAPFVSGVAGLVLSLHPSYSPSQVRAAILNSADHPSPLSGGFTATSGRVNASGALNASPSGSWVGGDGTMEGAQTINYKKTGTLSIPSDENDIYRANLRRGKRYAAFLAVPNRADFDLYVWKPGSTDTWPVGLGCRFSCQSQGMSIHGTGRNEYVEFTAKRSGTYYFHVTDFRGAGRYALFLGVPS